ncbi:MAG: hypothetical protein RL033_7014, partial [Pseudomonadota bacterium]
HTPIRFRDGGDALERELLASVDSDQAPSESRARVALQLGLVSVASSTAAALPSGTAASPSGTAALPVAATGVRWLHWSALKKGLFVGVATTVAIVSGFWLRAPALPEVSAPVPPVRAAPPAQGFLAPQPPLPELTLVPEPAPSFAPPLSPRQAARSRAPRSTARATQQRGGALRSEQSNRLLAEVAQLDRVRAELRAERAASALSELDAYDGKFPAGELELEAAVLRVQGLLASQDRSAAVALARRTLERPGSERYRTELQRALASYPSRERSRTAP